MYDDLPVRTPLLFITSDDISQGWQLKVLGLFVSNAGQCKPLWGQPEAVLSSWLLIMFHCNPIVKWYLHDPVLHMNPSFLNHPSDGTIQNPSLSTTQLPTPSTVNERREVHADHFHVASTAHLHPLHLWLADDAQPPTYKSTDPSKNVAIIVTISSVVPLDSFTVCYVEHWWRPLARLCIRWPNPPLFLSFVCLMWKNNGNTPA